MSNWPEPTHDPAEPPRWGKWAALAGIIAAVVVLAPRGGQWPSFALPVFEMPEISMPDFSMPETSSPSISSQAPVEETPPAVAVTSEDPFLRGLMPTELPDGSTVQTMAFDDCLEALQRLTSSLGQTAVTIEDTQDRYVASIKFVDSDLRITCSRADNTMTVASR